MEYRVARHRIAFAIALDKMLVATRFYERIRVFSTQIPKRGIDEFGYFIDSTARVPGEMETRFSALMFRMGCIAPLDAWEISDEL